MSLNKKQSKDRVEFAFKVLVLLSEVLRKTKIFPLEKLRTRVKKFNRTNTKQFLRQNTRIRDSIYNSIDDPSSLRAVPDAVEAIQNNNQIVNSFFESVPAPSPTPTEKKETITPSPTPKPSPTPTPSQELERANEIARRLTGSELKQSDKPIGQRLTEHLKNNGYDETAILEIFKGEEASRGLLGGMMTPEIQAARARRRRPNLAEVQQAEQIQQEQDFSSDISELPIIENATQQTPASQVPIPRVERVETRSTAPVTAPSGDVQRDIIESSKEGKHTPQPRPLTSSQTSGVQGLGLSAQQIRRMTENIGDEATRRATSEILGRNEINFNNIVDSLGQAAALSIIGSMMSTTGLAPIVGAAIPQIRRAFGADFNQYFRTRGNQIEFITSNVARVRDQNLARLTNNQNVIQLNSLRNRLLQMVQAGTVPQNIIDSFDNASFRRYFINNDALFPEAITTDEALMAGFEFLGGESEIVTALNEIMDGTRPITELQETITGYQDVLNDQPLIPTIEETNLPIFREAVRVPYFQAVNDMINQPERSDENFAAVRDILIRSELSINQIHQMLEGFRNTFNDVGVAINPERVVVVELPTTGQLQEERNQLQAIRRGETVRDNLVGGAVAGGLTSAGIAAARGMGLQASLKAGLTGAVRGAGIGAGIGATEAMSGGASAIPSIIAGVAAGVQQGLSTTPIQPPPDTLKVIQQEQKSKKGTLRPKFIVPSTSILEKSQSEIQGDIDEFSMFDFVIPSSEGTQGNNKNNPLKRSDYLTNQLRLNGGGIELDVPLGELDLATKATINEVMVGPELPEMTFENSVYNLSEFEVTPYDPNDDRLQIEALNPYKYYSRVQPYDISRSVLFSKVP
jgi:hypothetical protein